MLKALSTDRWNYELAAHLLNRAGFGGSPDDIQQLADLTHDQAVASLLDYERIPDSTPDPVWAKPDPDHIRQLRDSLKTATPDERKMIQQQESKTQYARMVELRGWWLNRMAKGPRPFQEKMVLFWHGHFATSVEKVRDPYYMWRQNELFRRLATGNWQQLLTDAGKDPAMLDLARPGAKPQGTSERKFCARSHGTFFAGRRALHRKRHHRRRARIDRLVAWIALSKNMFIARVFTTTAIKPFLVVTGNLNGEDVMAQIVAQPQAARFITAKIWNYFAGQPPSDELNDALAAVLRANGNNFKPFLRVMFRSEEFYDAVDRPQRGQKPGAMARRQRADARMRFAARADQLGHDAPAWTGFVRAAKCQRLGWRHHLDHDKHVADALQRRRHARAGHVSTTRRRTILRANRAALAAKRLKKSRNGFTSAA